MKERGTGDIIIVYIILLMFVVAIIGLWLGCSEDDSKPIEESFRVVIYSNAIGDTVYRVQEWYSQQLHPAVLNFANNSHYQWWTMRSSGIKVDYATKQKALNKIQDIIKQRIAERDKIFHRIEMKD